MYRFYDSALAVAEPFVRAVLAARKRHRPLLERFDPPVPEGAQGAFWVHACSVGEVNLAAHFIRALRAARPELSQILTVSTVSGRARAEETLADTNAITWFPFDRRRTVQDFFERLRPMAIVLLETELWPNVLREAATQRVPVALINGRLSDTHFSRYKRAQALFGPLVNTLAVAAMQNEEYGRRIAEIGTDPARIHVTGNMKFDSAPPRIPREEADTLREELGIASNAPVVVFGSTRPGDEQRARTAWDALRQEHPDLTFVVAPRHLQRLDEAVRPFRDQPVLLRSEVRSGRKPGGERIVVIDTMGELNAIYAIADIAVVGGSFSRDVQGHNPIEPAAQGVPVVLGPCMRNFADATGVLLESGGAVQAGTEELTGTLGALLADPQRRAAMAASAHAVVESQTGATARTMALLAPLIDAACPNVSTVSEAD